MSEPKNWDVLARYLADEATPVEAKEIHRWIDSDPENLKMIQKLQSAYSIEADESNASDLNALWNNISREIGRSKYVITRKSSFQGVADWMRSMFAARPLLVPAVALVAVLALAWGPYHIMRNSPVIVEIDVPLGERKIVVLEDGTRVVLDAGSQFEYPVEFASDSRRVTLQGQGYFQVTRDASRPFVVTAGAGVVEVLGTTFDVQSWSDSLVVLFVEEGRVKFGRAGGDADHSVILIADQVSSLGPDNGPSVPAAVDVSRRLAWMRDEVFYEDTPLSDVLDRLRRWHDVSVTVSDPALLHERLTLHMIKSDLPGSLDLLARLLNLDVTRDGRFVLLTRRGAS